MKKDTINLIIILCIATILVFGFKLGTTLRDYEKADNVYSELREIKNNSDNNNEENNNSNNDDNEENSSNNDENINNDNNNEEDKDNTDGDTDDTNETTNSLSSINPDYKFWINVEGTNIDYPVVQGTDNDFYLTHDFNKDYLPAGSIFLDYKNDLKNDTNLVIYGHHMKNSTMFGQMEKFKDKNFFNKNKIITITDEDGTHEYEIFAIGVYDANFEYRNTNFESEKDFDNFLDKIMSKAMYKRDIVSSKDKIITLSTCSYEFDNARTAIFAVRK